MGYTQFTFTLKEGVDANIVSAFLDLAQVDSMWEEEQEIHAYFKDETVSDFDGEFAEYLESICGDFVTKIAYSKPKDVNWNSEWEKNFPAVEVDDYCYIYADFHEKKNGFSHYIKIAPKMAFGTGHHETTYMMIQAMKDISLEGKDVLDLGCGTGILAVLAAQRDALSIDAIDIELPSYENTLEHAEMNKVHMNVLHGGVEDVPEKQYDVILANINRNVLLTYSKAIQSKLKSGGILLLSGILHQDKTLIADSYSALELQEMNSRGSWLCFHYQFPS